MEEIKLKDKWYIESKYVNKVNKKDIISSIDKIETIINNILNILEKVIQYEKCNIPRFCIVEHNRSWITSII